MTVRDYWYKTAPIDILKRMADLANETSEEKPICIKLFIQNEKIPVEKCSQNCSKCLENFLNEEFKK